MADVAHEPVLLASVLELLAPRDHGIYLDGTLGRAGHARALLERARDATFVGIDRDPAALAAARETLAPYPHVHLIHGEYADASEILSTLKIDRVDGVLLDLGVSSPQLDEPARGFSFTRPGPIDMRMDPTRGRTAAELIRETDVDTLAELVHELGEERYAKRIARLIKDADREDKLHTTTDLAAVIAHGIPLAEQRRSRIHPATRTFQALRIAVNSELEQLARFLDGFPDLLAPDGRCAIISFHSLEDRLVKNRFRDLAWTSSLPPHLAERAGERVEPVCEPVTKKPVIASDDEIERNPRARSAKLRVCRRTTFPNLPAKR